MKCVMTSLAVSAEPQKISQDVSNEIWWSEKNMMSEIVSA